MRYQIYEAKSVKYDAQQRVGMTVTSSRACAWALELVILFSAAAMTRTLMECCVYGKVLKQEKSARLLED